MKPIITLGSGSATRRDMIVIGKMLVPLIAVIAIAIHFSHFVINAIEANIAINGLIITTLGYGTSLILTRLMGAQEDFRIIERFGFEAAAGTPMNQLLEQPWIRHRYVRHYLKHIAATEGALSSALDQNAIESELHALSAEYSSKLELPQFLVGFMIALGLLGTFIGLLETLTGISGMLDGMGKGNADASAQFMSLVTELRKPLAGMGIAFSASMFGLVGSLMLAIMMINLRRYISRVVMCARNVMHDLTEITRKTAPLALQLGQGAQGGVPMAAAPVRERTLAEDAMRSPDSNVLLASRMDLMMNKLETLFKSFDNSISSTNRLNELLGFGPRMKETGERTLDELKVIAKNTDDQHRLTQQLVDANGAIVGTIGGILDMQRRGQHELTMSIKTLNERVSAVEETNIGNGRHLWDIRENCAKLSVSSGILDMIASSIGRQTILSEVLVEEARILKDWFAASAQQHTGE